MLLFGLRFVLCSRDLGVLRAQRIIGFFILIGPCDIRHAGIRNNTIYLLWEIKSIVMQKYLIVLSSNMAYVAEVYNLHMNEVRQWDHAVIVSWSFVSSFHAA